MFLSVPVVLLWKTVVFGGKKCKLFLQSFCHISNRAWPLTKECASCIKLKKKAQKLDLDLKRPVLKSEKP